MPLTDFQQTVNALINWLRILPVYLLSQMITCCYGLITICIQLLSESISLYISSGLEISQLNVSKSLDVLQGKISPNNHFLGSCVYKSFKNLRHAFSFKCCHLLLFESLSLLHTQTSHSTAGRAVVFACITLGGVIPDCEWHLLELSKVPGLLFHRRSPDRKKWVQLIT